jgi:hypothetical protein
MQAQRQFRLKNIRLLIGELRLSSSLQCQSFSFLGLRKIVPRSVV